MTRLNKEIISFIVFLAAFTTFIMSSYGIGKAEADNDKPLKDFALAGLIISIIAMIAVWIVNWSIQTPDSRDALSQMWFTKVSTE